jgi:DNA-binding SARP family transcriptional activator
LYRFYVLGQLRLVGPAGDDVRKVVAGELRLGLLAFLALGMPAGRRRDSLVAMFWPEADAEEARHRLRQALYMLRTELGSGVLTTNGREQVVLNPDRFWCDAVSFEAALRAGDLEAAQELYGGDLCEGLFISRGGIERWIERERERLHERATDSAWQLALQHEAAGRLREAVRWGSRAVELGQDEEQLRQVIGMCVRAGDRLRALKVYGRYERRLADEYDLTPDPATTRLISTLQSGGMSPDA